MTTRTFKITGGTLTVEEVDAPVEQPPPTTGSGPGQSALEVGPSRTVKEPADAMGLLGPGGEIVLDDGVYLKPLYSENEGLTIRSASGNPFACYFDGQGGEGGGHPLSGHKGMLRPTRSINVVGVGFRRCGSPRSGSRYGNEAGIWIGDTGGTVPVTVVVRRCAFDDNGNGVFAAGERNVTVRSLESIYGYLRPNGQNASIAGGGGGAAHDIYVGCGEVEVSGSYHYGCCGGHAVKSRAPKTNVHDNPCLTQDGGRVLDASDGGEVAFRSNVIFTRKDRTSQPPAGTFGNANCIAYAGESASQGVPGMAQSGNTFHISRQNSVIAAGNGGKISASGDTVRFYENGSLVLQGSVSGISGGAAPPNAGPAPALPQPPSWAKPKDGDQGDPG